jgi:eukaryotic-like serine/threonine-protein kinase
MPSPSLLLFPEGEIPISLGSIAVVRLLELLGMGAFGSVWKAQDPTTKKFYALKVIQNLEPGSLLCDRVRLEAEVVIPSPYIVPAIGLRQWDESTYLILFDYYQATALNQWISSGKLNSDQKRQIFQQLLCGVRDAHRSNIIHRDLKPGNVLVNDQFDIKIIDFGISKFRGAGLTKTREYMGTLAYMPPEAFIAGSRKADARTDIYALGQILYELEMGQNFWQRRGWFRLSDFVAYLQQDPPPTEGIDLRDFKGDCYPNTATVIAQMVKLDYSDRIPTIDAVLDALEIVAPDATTSAPDFKLGFPLLIVESGTNRDACLPLSLADGEVRVIGRADIAGSDYSISGRHLEIRRIGADYQIRELGSKNGTLLRGNVLTPDEHFVTLQAGDRIKVGDIFLRVEFR